MSKVIVTASPTSRPPASKAAFQVRPKSFLTIRGVTRNVVFDVEGPSPAQKDPWGNTRIGLSARTRIRRKDFGLTWKAVLEAGGLLVGDAVTMTLDIQCIRER